MAANVYLRQFNPEAAWVRLAEKPLVCRAMLFNQLFGLGEGEVEMRFAGGAAIVLPADLQITFDGVDLHDLEVYVREGKRVFLFAQSR
jgi:hypothetical protein